jgi:hypothetical protein
VRKNHYARNIYVSTEDREFDQFDKIARQKAREVAAFIDNGEAHCVGYSYALQIPIVISNNKNEFDIMEQYVIPLNFPRLLFVLEQKGIISSQDAESIYKQINEHMEHPSSRSYQDWVNEMIEEITNQLRKVLQKIPHVYAAFTQDPFMIHSIARLIEKHEIDLGHLSDLLETKLSILNEDASQSLKEVAASMIEKTIMNYTDFAYQNKDEYYKEIFSLAKKSITLEEVLDEINTDIELLSNLLKDTVLKAMSLEKPFLSMVNKQLNTLIEKLDSQDFEEFISKNATKIKYLEYQKLEEQKGLLVNRKVIVERIKDVLAEIRI